MLVKVWNLYLGAHVVIGVNYGRKLNCDDVVTFMVSSRFVWNMGNNSMLWGYYVLHYLL